MIVTLEEDDSAGSHGVDDSLDCGWNTVFELLAVSDMVDVAE